MRTKLVLTLSIALGALLASPTSAEARARDGSAAWRFDGRAVNGSFAQPVGSGPDRWLSANSTTGNDVSLALVDIFGNSLATGSIGFSCSTVPCLRTNSIYPFKGHFTRSNQDDMCVYYRDMLSNQTITCFDQYGSTLYAGNPSESNTSFVFSMPTTPTGGHGYTVGDFDGDGYDEIVTYNRWDGSAARAWHYDKSSYRFVENPNLIANVGGLSWAGGVQFFAGNFHNADGLIGLDDLVAYNQTTHQVIVYESRRPSLGYARFWTWYGPWGVPGASGDVEVSVARYAETGFDALVLNTAQGTGNRGKLNAFSLAYPMTDITSMSDMANMQTAYTTGFTGKVHLVWAEINSPDALRDDTIQFFDDYSQYSVYDAHPGSPAPWWIWFARNTGAIRGPLGL